MEIYTREDYAAMMGVQRGSVSMAFPKDEPLFATRQRVLLIDDGRALSHLLGIFGGLTGLTLHDVVDVVLDSTKEPEMLRKISEHARRSTQRFPLL